MVRSIKNLIAAILIAISSYLAWTNMLPAYAVTSYFKDHIEEKSLLLASRNEIMQKIQKLREENGTRYAELQRLALVVPDKRGFPELITAIENIYSRSGIILPGIVLSASTDSGRVGSIDFRAEGSGTYGQILVFLDFLEKNIRLFDITDIDVNIDPELVGSDPGLNFIMDGKFYWLQPDSGGSPQIDDTPIQEP